MGLNHLTSGRFPATADWLAEQVTAHNLAHRTKRIGLGEQVATTNTLGRRFFSISGHLTCSATASPCVFPSTGLGKTSSATPCRSFPDCATADV